MTVAEMPQHMQALAIANEVRAARTELKHAIKAGDVTVPEVLLGDIPEWLEKMPVEELICATHRVGTQAAYPMLSATPTHPLTPVGRLTMRQRGVLAEMTERWAERPRPLREAPDFSGVVGMGV